jgi:hypothetical protein
LRWCAADLFQEGIVCRRRNIAGTRRPFQIPSGHAWTAVSKCNSADATFRCISVPAWSRNRLRSVPAGARFRGAGWRRVLRRRGLRCRWRQVSRRSVRVSCSFGEGHAGAQPCGRGSVAAVVDAHWLLADRCEATVPGAGPVRSGRASVVAGAEQQPIWRGEPVGVGSFAQDVDEHGWDRHRAWSGFGFAGFIEGDVCFGEIQLLPTLVRPVSAAPRTWSNTSPDWKVPQPQVAGSNPARALEIGM